MRPENRRGTVVPDLPPAVGGQWFPRLQILSLTNEKSPTGW